MTGFQEEDDRKRKKDLEKQIKSRKIPEQLRRPEFRFTPVKFGEKGPYLPGWNTNNNFPFNDPELARHLEYENYAVLTGLGGLIAVDADKVRVAEICETLPKTLTVATSVKEDGFRGSHSYYLCPEFAGESKVILENDEGHFGEIQTQGFCVVGPSSVHPTGAVYEVVKDLPIATITREQLETAFAEFIKKPYEQLPEEEGEKFPILKVVDTSKLTKRGDEWYGAHPVHGSETGQNFWVNEKTNQWYCFRHHVGGGTLSLIAVLEELIKCEDVKAGVLKDIWQQLKKVAQEKHKIEIGIKLLSYNDKLVWLKKIKDMELVRQKFLVEDLLPENSVCLFFGKRQAYKSWLGLDMALRLASGTNWLNKFVCSKHRVLFIDEENGIAEMLRRIKKLLAGMKIEEWPDNFALLSCENIRLDRADSRKALGKLIEDYKFEVVFVDVLRRVHSLAEDKADDINLLYSDVLKPFAAKYGMTWILLGHSRKTQSRGSEFDIMDELRGSSEFVNVADVIFFADTEGGRMKDQLVLRQAKMRRGPLVKPVLISVSEDKEEEGEPISFVFDKYLEEEEGLIAEIVAKAYLDYCLNHDIKKIRTKDLMAYSIKLGYGGRSGQRAIDELKKMKVISGKRSPFKLLTGRGEKLGDYEDSEEND